MGCLNSTSQKGEQSSKKETSRKQSIKLGQGRKQQGVHELKQNYNISDTTRVLGSGAFGRVFWTTNKFDTNFQVAIKVLDKNKLKDNIACIMEEVAILNKLDHPNIVKYYETYDDAKYIYLVMEYISGMQLFDKITHQKNQTFDEGQAAKYMKQLFQAINHCHAQNIVHRDIKPENIMITDDDEVRLIDFGLSKASNGKKALQTVAGTPYYMAPEVLDGNYQAKADIWSLGVLMYTLVSGYLPFQGKNSAEVFRKIGEADFHFNHKEFDTISQECKNLISKLLVVNPNKRLTGQKALQDPWFKKQLSSDPEQKLGGAINDEVIQRLQDFKGVSTFKRAAMNLLVKTATDEEVRDLRRQFQAIDTDGTGMIKASELSAVIQQKKMSISQNEIKDLIEQMDYYQTGKINYSEFLSATIDVKSFLSEQRLQAIFNQFDTDGSGFITKDNIFYAMQKLGQNIERDEIQEMISKHDITKNGMLSFDEFKMIFLDKEEPDNNEEFRTK